MKKLLTIALCATMAMSFAACGEASNSTVADEQQSSNTAQLPNPFKDCKTLDEAEEIAGFTITPPGTAPNWFNEMVYRAQEGTMIEIIYRGEGEEMVVRKAVGNEDISGDYNEYAETSEIKSGDKTVSARGNDGIISVATWQEGEYSYSLTLKNGIEKDNVASILADVK